MNAVLNLEQGTVEWHEHRSKYRNASETPAVLGVSPWVTPYELWLVKTGRKTIEENEAMRHGTAMEPYARAAYEQETGQVMQPKVVVEGEYSASLDGISMDGELILEIKCPFRGQASELWQVVKTGQVPDHYMFQVQHQLMLSGASMADLWVFDGQQGIRIPIEPNHIIMENICEAWNAFQTYLDTDTPPPLCDQDTVLREDLDWQVAAEDFKVLKQMAEEAAVRADEAKAKLIALAKHSREAGSGVIVTRYWKAGAVDYKKVPELGPVDLEQYRGKAKEEVRVTVMKEAKP